MTATTREHFGELTRWTARLWSLPLIAGTFLVAAGPLNPVPFKFGYIELLLSSLSAMSFAVAFVVAWRWERIGGWIAIVCAVAFTTFFAVRFRHLPLGPMDSLFWAPAVLFLLSGYSHKVIGHSGAKPASSDQKTCRAEKPRCYFALRKTNLGWSALVIGTGFFIFMRLFWTQAGNPGRNRSTFFSDPINATCLIGAFASPVVAMILALASIIWKRERSLLFLPLLLLGLFALLWAVAVISGANA